MKIIPLYRYEREDGGITVSPIKPECEYTEKMRLVADEGKVLVLNGENYGTATDTYTTEGWTEIDDPEPMPEPTEEEGEIDE